MTIVEGGNANISCTSIGIPVPIIIWKLNNQVTSFDQTDIIAENTSARIVRQGDDLVSVASSGRIVSTLHIENPHYPEHMGTYECIGIDPGNTSISNTALITVQLEG